ncbi:Coiled-coil domain-containing protein 25 [Gracilariopsis chorda]|uniref:Coiled-coil domain-containing protein 25 n=1 Tax=Gracilariopsis chorda TaxID=448386 RepID=A0A2V3IHJ2_9FLOR|nr:Coiled-coil domain-containing protein 25 [Gracilariopsis chorda]|eukprot:PXF41564.1 Coiled-coil domain-containing protein 25 [Gracilariopsis chorda]
MVFYYKTRDDSYHVYVGKDKYENEELIKHGWDNDVWFHVDKLSSAHVYLRLKDGETIESIPEGVLEDCVQLVKHNSIEGNKMNNVGVVYTYWNNLKKTGDMEVGQVSFHKVGDVKRIVVEKRINDIVNRLNRTKSEAHPDFAQEKTNRMKYLNRVARDEMRKKAERERTLREQRQKEKEARSYDRIHQEKDMTSNKDIRQDYTEFEEDFM